MVQLGSCKPLGEAGYSWMVGMGEKSTEGEGRSQAMGRGHFASFCMGALTSFSWKWNWRC